MTCRTLKTLAAAALGTAILAGPAAAGGSLSVSYNPTNAQDALTLATALRLYALFEGVKNGGKISQNGMNNEAGLAQYGSGNLGIVHQEGDGHSGTLQQVGTSNTYGLFQFGQNTDGHVTQTGNGQAGATFQFGW
jgi:hypothetical protein